MIKHSDLFGYVKQFGNYPKQETTKTEELFDNIFKKTGSKPTKQTLTKEIVNRLKLGHSGNTNSKKQLSQSKNRTGADIGSHQSQVIKSERHQNSNTNGCNPREVKSRPEQKTNGNSCTSDKSGQRVSQNATVHSDNNQRLNEASMHRENNTQPTKTNHLTVDTNNNKRKQPENCNAQQQLKSVYDAEKVYTEFFNVKKLQAR